MQTIQRSIQNSYTLRWISIDNQKKRKKTTFEHWNNEIPKFAYHLRTWGEAGVVSLRDIKKFKETKAKG